MAPPSTVVRWTDLLPRFTLASGDEFDTLQLHQLFGSIGARQAIPPEGRLPRGVLHRDPLQKSQLNSHLDDAAIIDPFTIGGNVDLRRADPPRRNPRRGGDLTW
jgi:hypothetical protein